MFEFSGAERGAECYHARACGFGVAEQRRGPASRSADRHNEPIRLRSSCCILGGMSFRPARLLKFTLIVAAMPLFAHTVSAEIMMTWNVGDDIRSAIVYPP